MFLVILLNTLTRLGVLPHFLENLSLSPCRVNLDKDGGKTGMFGKKVSLDRGTPKRTEDEALVSFHSHRGERKKILHAARKQISRKRFSLYVLQ